MLQFSGCSRYSYSLRAGRSEDRIPVETRISAPVQTGRGAHPAAYTMGNGSLQVVKWPGRDVDRPPTSSAEIKERVELYLYSPCGNSSPVIGRPLPSLCSVTEWGGPDVAVYRFRPGHVVQRRTHTCCQVFSVCRTADDLWPNCGM